MSQRHRARVDTRTPDAITLAASTWLACGCVLLGLVPLPLHTAALGWSPLFWLLLAPAILLYARHLCAHAAPLPNARPRIPEHAPVPFARRRRRMQALRTANTPRAHVSTRMSQRAG